MMSKEATARSVISTERAMKLALEALAVKFSEGWHEGIKIDASDIMLLNDAAQALSSEAKEQPRAEGTLAQQKPAGSVYRYGKDSSGKQWHGIRWTASGLDLPDGTLIYTSPPAQQEPFGFAVMENPIATPAQQEPVGYVAENGVVDWNICAPPIMTDLYTAPPAQRKPLTDEQKRELIKKSKLWDMQVHIGWYSAPAKSFVEKAMLLIADIEAAHGIKENT